MTSEFRARPFSEVRNIVTDIKGLVYKGSQNFKQNRGNILLTFERISFERGNWKNGEGIEIGF